jgi:hypothetical protein
MVKSTKGDKMTTLLRLCILTTLIVFASPKDSLTETLTSIFELKQGTRIHKYLFSKDQFEVLYRVGVEWDKKLGLQQNCKSQYQVKPYNTALLAPIDFPNEKEHPTKGIWRYRFQLERCGETKIYNAIFAAQNDGKPQVLPHWPGDTRASPRLIYDALTSAIASASAKIKNVDKITECKDLTIFDMKVSEEPHDVVENGITIRGVWWEKWTFLACGQYADVLLRFTPDGAKAVRSL